MFDRKQSEWSLEPIQRGPTQTNSYYWGLFRGLLGTTTGAYSRPYWFGRVFAWVGFESIYKAAACQMEVCLGNLFGSPYNKDHHGRCKPSKKASNNQGPS